MVLRGLIKHLDYLMEVHIYTADDPDTVAWKGIVLDIPWIYLTMLLDTDSNGEAISVSTDANMKPYMIIWLRETDSHDYD